MIALLFPTTGEHVSPRLRVSDWQISSGSSVSSKQRMKRRSPRLTLKSENRPHSPTPFRTRFHYQRRLNHHQRHRRLQTDAGRHRRRSQSRRTDLSHPKGSRNRSHPNRGVIQYQQPRPRNRNPQTHQNRRQSRPRGIVMASLRRKRREGLVNGFALHKESGSSTRLSG